MHRIATVRLDILKRGIVDADTQARHHREVCDEQEERLLLLRDEVATAENLLDIEKGKASDYELQRDDLRNELERLERDIAEGRATTC